MAGEDDLLDSLFQEPEDFYQPEKPATHVEYRLHSGDTIALRLVGHSPLWRDAALLTGREGHYLWNAGKVIADYLEQRGSELVKGKTILELGAGAGLPSIVCALKGARKVVITDYPDPDLIANLRENVRTVLAYNGDPSVTVEGYLWGSSPDKILSHLDEPSAGFDMLILADLVFNHSEHSKLVASVQKSLKKSVDARALVFFTPYRPWLLEKDLAFFEVARKAGFSVEKTLEKVMDKVMFSEDPGDELLRRTVFGYELRWVEVS
ncbi:MAG: nicotinamide n-methyltransferase [Cirrosporium novae-zelandiae]|nr:MAG: nicotinamide n-methyltransferase [Cirrosporium novae-zelandiae]